MLGVAAATHCRSDRENDRQGEFRRRGGGDDPLPGDLLLSGCRGGCRGGRQEVGGGEIELLKFSPRRNEPRLELAVGLFTAPLFFKGLLQFLSLLWANKFLRFFIKRFFGFARSLTEETDETSSRLVKDFDLPL